MYTITAILAALQVPRGLYRWTKRGVEEEVTAQEEAAVELLKKLSIDMATSKRC